MSNRSVQNAKSASASINAALSVLNGVTPSTVESEGNGFSIRLNPFQFIIGLLQPIVGYDRIVNFLSELSVYGLPVIEDSVKITIVEALKGLFSCSINPVIGEELINNGVVLDLSKIDLLNIMNRCPLDNENSMQKIKGAFFYSGVDDMTIPDQLEGCSDLNAVIWFVKHRSNDRTVWYGYKTQGDEHELLTMDTQPSAEHGVITMEYSENASQLKDSIGNEMPTQVPHGNCLHVFIGNTKGVSESTTPYPSSNEILEEVQDFRDVSNTLANVLGEIEIQSSETTDIAEKTALSCEASVVRKITNAIENGVPIEHVIPGMLTDDDTGKKFFTVGGKKITLSLNTYTKSKNDIANEMIELNERRRNYVENYSYREPSQNYYYHKTLFEFNTDYIMSVKFFDSKVLASQIVDILTGCFDFSLNISFEERLVRDEVEKMLSKIIETGDTTVSDCFFSFSNDDYNLMVDKTERERMGEYTGDNSSYGSQINYNTIYEELNSISNSASLSEQVTTITHAMNTISRTIKPEIYTESKEYELNYEFLNNLLKGLTLSLVYNIISPKIYMLMAINLKILGRQPNFDLSTFLETFKSMIINVVRGISNKIMEEMREWLVSLVQDLVVRLEDRLLMEQAEYYIRLLSSCIRSCAFMFGGGTEDWNMADVEYADIYSNTTGDNAVNTNC